jgi:hypothetical protein
MIPDPQKVFTETQKIEFPVVRQVAFTLSVFSVGGLAYFLIAPYNNSALAPFAIGFFMASCAMLIIDIFVFFSSLFIRIDERGIMLNQAPAKTEISYNWENVDQIFLRENFIWIRSTFKNGMGYNIKAQKGIQIILKSGEKLQIGIHNMEAAQPIIEYYFKAKIPRFVPAGQASPIG